MVCFFVSNFIYNKKGRISMKKNNGIKICSICRTGMETHQLDPKEIFCPYLHFLEENGCKMFDRLSELNDVGGNEDE